ncbi:hypothetical protein [Flammeovirga sp. SJP92]|uniref:hypothetical protein n=1 Tax=Flammeovirga sp. SJP92 TaxID=1775430 RepID=UPI0007878BE1|nr:hypothetical protein [Flammeovirga sp. SJP92]KXX69462.1 hypothetical protein AVL50_19110 [Flammeovirga sp. SJP92]
MFFGFIFLISCSQKSLEKGNQIYESDLSLYREHDSFSLPTKKSLDEKVSHVVTGKIISSIEYGNFTIYSLKIKEVYKGASTGEIINLIELKRSQMSTKVINGDSYLFFGTLINNIMNSKPVLEGARPKNKLDDSSINIPVTLVLPPLGSITSNKFNFANALTKKDYSLLEKLFDKNKNLFYVTSFNFHSMDSFEAKKIIGYYN